MVKVKICGITNLEDALLACDLGAAALGFIFYEKSPRYIHPALAKAIIESLPPFITTVGVFINKGLNDLHEICKTVPLNMVQLHGEETSEYCKQVFLPCLKVFRVKQNFNLLNLKKYKAAGFLLDTFNHHHYGGTGESFDWNFAVEAKKYGRIVLSGGLDADNVLQAIKFVKPYAVDVCSGVEASPGKKDTKKLKKLFEAISRQYF